MPALNPLAKDVMHLFRQEKYEPCSSTKPLTSIKMNETTATAYLVLDEKMTHSKGYEKLTCCYQEISRSGSGKYADEQFK